MPTREREPRPTWDPVARRCADHHGILVLAEALKAGVGEHQVRRLVAEGLLVREFRGIYRWAGSPPVDLQRIELAVRATGGIASHQSAARLWGFGEWGSDTVHVTLPRGTRPPRRPWLITHTTGRPLGSSTLTRRGIDTTKPLRTLLDVAGTPVTDEELAGLFAHFTSRRLLSASHVASCLDQPAHGVAGRSRLRALLAELDGDTVESVAEHRLLLVLASAGIERPKTQFPIYRDGRFVARADAAWPHARVVLEIDGYRYHSDPHSFVADRERGNEIVAAGYRLLRTTPTAIREHPERLCHEVSEALKLASRPSVA